MESLSTVDKVKELQAAHGVRPLAKLLNLDETTVRNWLAGRRNPNPHAVKRIEALYLELKRES